MSQTRATLAAVALHGSVLAVLVLLHGIAKSKSAGLGADQVVAVTLVSAASPGASPAPSSSDAAEQLQRLQQRLTSGEAATATEALRRAAEPTRLSDLLGEAKAASPPAPSKAGGAGDGSASLPVGGGQGGMADPFALAAVSPQLTREMVQNPGAQVQAQANACWRGAPASNAVRLAIDLDAGGRLTRPPVIKRDLFAKLDDQTRAAEAQAIRAAVTCAPYRLASASSIRSYDLIFR